MTEISEVRTKTDYLVEYLELRDCERQIVETYMLLKAMGKIVMQTSALDHLTKGMA